MNEYKCQVCGKPATMHYIETINGITKETHYCSECAKAAKTSGFDPFESMYGTSGILNSIFGTPSIKREAVCECGMTERELLNSCKFGCSKCYLTFENIAQRLIDNVGGGVYIGDKPNAVAQHMATATEPNVKVTAQEAKETQDKPMSELDQLMAELDVAIREQRFVDCDKIKKKIDKLRQDKKKEG